MHIYVILVVVHRQDSFVDIQIPVQILEFHMKQKKVHAVNVPCKVGPTHSAFCKMGQLI